MKAISFVKTENIQVLLSNGADATIANNVSDAHIPEWDDFSTNG